MGGICLEEMREGSLNIFLDDFLVLILRAFIWLFNCLVIYYCYVFSIELELTDLESNKMGKFWENWGKIVIIAVGVLYFLLLAGLKNGFYVDEIFSFGHANSTVGAFMSPSIDAHFVDENNDLHGKWIENEMFRKYLMVQKGEGGNFENIYQNLAKDVHPPLYFMLLHLMSSLFADELNIWAGLSINLVCLVLLILLVNRLLVYLFKDVKKANFLTLLFLFLPSVIELMAFVRMYELFLLFNVWLCYLAFKVIDEKGVNYKLLSFVGVAIGGACLTHLYGLVYGFFVALGVMGCLAVEKRFIEAFLFGLFMLLGVVISGIVFPYMVDILFYSERGEESLEAVSFFDSSLWFFRFDYFLKQFFRATFGVKGEWHWGMLLVVLSVLFWGIKEKGLREIFDKKSVFLLFVAVMGCVVVSVVAPDMRKFSGRYYVVGAFYFVLWLFMIGDKVFSLNRGRKICGVVLCLIMVVGNMIRGVNNPYLQRDSQIKEFSQYVKDKRVITLIGYKEVVFNFGMLDSFLGAKSVYKLNAGELEEIEEFLLSDEPISGDIVILYAGMGKNVGNKKTMEQEKYRLKYKDILFMGMHSYEIYERY